MINTEERIVSIETRIAFYEKTIDELGSVVYKQQKEIDVLREKIVSLEEIFNTTGNFVLKDVEDETPPPHY